jgi:hypothetical protein
LRGAQPERFEDGLCVGDVGWVGTVLNRAQR